MSSDGQQFYWGDFVHPKGEVYPKKIEIIPRFVSFGVRWAQDIRLQVAGSFVNQNPELDEDGTDARIIELRTAYQENYKDCGFLLSNGNPSDHYLLTDHVNNLSGNRILHRSWDNTYPTEMANTRSFTVTIGALFKMTAAPNVVHWTETTQKIGTGGPVWRLYNRWDGEPVKEEIFNNSKVVHVTRGTIIGLYDWPLAPLPYWPDEEQEWKRINIQGTPLYHGHPDFDRPTHFPVHYAYFFERLGPDPLNPNLWYSSP